MVKFYALVIAGLVGLFLFSNNLNFFGPSKTSSYGKVTRARGTLMGKLGNKPSFINVESGARLQRINQLVTGIDGEASLDFGGLVKIKPNSSVRLEKMGGLYKVSLLAGEIEREQVLESQPFFIGNKLTSELKVIHPDKISTDEIEDLQKTHSDPTRMVDKKTTKKLEDTLKLHRRFIEKCFIKHFDKMKGDTHSGVVLTRFKITKVGQLKDVVVSKSDYQDSSFHECVVEVLSRVKIKYYDGRERILDFPIQMNIPN